MDGKYNNIESLFKKATNRIAEYFNIDANDVFGSNREDCVNARYCLIYILCNKYTDYEISKALPISKSGVNKIRNNFSNKMNIFSFKNDFNCIKSLNLIL